MAPPRKVKKDYGLREREATSYNPQTEEEVDEFRKAFSSIFKSPDRVRDENADHVRKVLSDAGTGPHDFHIKEKFGEQAAYVTMAEWLRAYEWVQRIRVRIDSGKAEPNDLSELIRWAEDLGKLQERIWWRHGVDPDTGTKRETLAVSARKSRRALPKGRMAIDAHNAEVKAEAEAHRRALQAKADIIWQRHPDWNKSEVARQILREWPKRNKAEPPKFNTLRNQIQKSDRA